MSKEKNNSAWNTLLDIMLIAWGLIAALGIYIGIILLIVCLGGLLFGMAKSTIIVLALVGFILIPLSLYARSKPI